MPTPGRVHPLRRSSVWPVAKRVVRFLIALTSLTVTYADRVRGWFFAQRGARDEHHGGTRSSRGETVLRKLNVIARAGATDL